MNTQEDTASRNGADPLHGVSDAGSTWTTTNIAEAMPGVLTPLGWTFWRDATERIVRRNYHAFGVLARSEADIPARDEERLIGIFYGRAATRVEFWCGIADRVPGTNGAALADQLLSSVPPGLESRSVRRRYPLVAARLPVAMTRAPRLAGQVQKVTNEWWSRELSQIPTANGEEARRHFALAVPRFEEILYCHGGVNFAVVFPIFDQLTRLAAAAGETGKGLMAGYGGHAETQMVMDLWECSRDRLALDTFVSRYGYHGPREGEISGVVWRENRSPLLQILDGYRSLGDGDDPLNAEVSGRAGRVQNEAEFLRALPPSRRVWGRSVLGLAHRYVPLRAVVKMAFLQGLDVARAAARRLGTCLADDGVLDDPADIFFLTKEEVCSGRWEGAKDLIALRRSRHEAYERLDLPVSWQGIPDPRPVETEMAEHGSILAGVAASSGVVEGVVRVVTDPSDANVEPGDIVVAHTTDPSWALVLFLSSALVVDIGGRLSHAAIVARELGVPCVVDTKVGTKVLRTGDRCRVDGDTGQIEVLGR